MGSSKHGRTYGWGRLLIHHSLAPPAMTLPPTSFLYLIHKKIPCRYCVNLLKSLYILILRKVLSGQLIGFPSSLFNCTYLSTTDFLLTA